MVESGKSDPNNVRLVIPERQRAKLAVLAGAGAVLALIDATLGEPHVEGSVREHVTIDGIDALLTAALEQNSAVLEEIRIVPKLDAAVHTT